MPSASSSPIAGRRCQQKNSVSGSTSPTLTLASKHQDDSSSAFNNAEANACDLKKARLPLSVASMVRRFERDSSLEACKSRGAGGSFPGSFREAAAAARRQAQGQPTERSSDPPNQAEGLVTGLCSSRSTPLSSSRASSVSSSQGALLSVQADEASAEAAPQGFAAQQPQQQTGKDQPQVRTGADPPKPDGGSRKRLTMNSVVKAAQTLNRDHQHQHGNNNRHHHHNQIQRGSNQSSSSSAPAVTKRRATAPTTTTTATNSAIDAPGSTSLQAARPSRNNIVNNSLRHAGRSAKDTTSSLLAGSGGPGPKKSSSTQMASSLSSASPPLSANQQPEPEQQTVTPAGKGPAATGQAGGKPSSPVRFLWPFDMISKAFVRIGPWLAL